MTLVAFPSSRSTASEEALQPFERLTVGLSTSFSALDSTEVEDALAVALKAIGGTFGADECTLIAYTDHGTARVVHAWAAEPFQPCTNEDTAHMPWLLQRLARNVVVATTPAADLPHAAARDRAHDRASGVSARLAVPIVLGTRVAYGLMIGSHHAHADWPTSLVDRLRLAGEIVAGGLERLRQADALQACQSSDRPGPVPADAQDLHDEAREQAEGDQIIGQCPAFTLALGRMAQVAALDATVLLLGETGTGKELVARALHERSRRRQRTLVRVNCAALPPSLIESELFGHERGAFTGAVAMRQGRFELADGGTIFLDEIGDLAPELQAKLLRVLQEGEFERVGSSKTHKVDVRVITATHVDLEKAVADGRFRADLYYRLSVFPITLPPLRDRREDIPQLVWFFIHRHQRLLGRRITNVPASVMEMLQRHDWAGNVRELENVVERAMIRSADGTLQLDDPLQAGNRMRESGVPGDSLDAIQRSHIEKVLRECGWRINGTGNAASRLGLHPNTLRFRIKKLGVELPRRPVRPMIQQ